MTANRGRCFAFVASVCITAFFAITSNAIAQAPTLGSRQIPTGALTEISGCAIDRRDPNIVWLHNDSGDGSVLQRLNLTTNKTTAVTVTNAPARDWEDIAVYANGDLLVADIGDNLRRRDNVKLIRVARPVPNAKTATVRKVTTLTYDDGPHDAESVVIDPKDETAVYVITKERDTGGGSTAFRVNGSRLERVAELADLGEFLPLAGQIAGADALPNGSGIVLRTYHSTYLLKRPTGGSFEDIFRAQPIAMPIDGAGLGQYESICVTPDGKRVVTLPESRGASTITVTIATLP